MKDVGVSVVKERAANRVAMPVVAAFVDELRAQGFAPKVIWAREGDHEVGQRIKNTEIFDIPRGYRMATAAEKRK